MVPFGNLPRRANLVGRPLAGTPVENLATVDEIAHGPHGLFERCARIGSVTEQDVDEVDLQSIEAPFDRVVQVLAIERVEEIGNLAVDSPEDLGGEHVMVTLPPQFANDAAHDRFALTAGVGLGVVEEVAASVPGRLHTSQSSVVFQLIVEGDPRTERQHGHLQAGAAQSAVFHLRIRDEGRGCAHTRTLRSAVTTSVNRVQRTRARVGPVRSARLRNIRPPS